MGTKLPKDVPYDTKTPMPSGGMLYDKALPDDIIKKYKDEPTNLNESEGNE